MLTKALTCSLLVILSFQVSISLAWDQEDFEVFDVVEEVGENFYTLLNIKQDANQSEIRKAFRSLSLQLHPDKNPSPDAEVKFRQLVSVYDILKDGNKRNKYHQVLENGLPNWKQAIFYYRRVRKMGLAEMSIILFIIITIGQYLFAWAAYLEKRYAIQEYIDMRSKKLQKKQKKGKLDFQIESLPDLMTSSILPKPSISCTLPVQICKLAWFLVFQLPPLTVRYVKWYLEERKRRKEQEALQEESEEEEVIVPKERAPRRRKERFTLPELKDDPQSTGNVKKQEQKEKKVAAAAPSPPPLAGGLWTDDDLEALVRYMKKFPAGTQERWEKIAELMQRTAAEVAHMAHKFKDEGFKPFQKQEEEEVVEEAEPKKVKTRGGKLGENLADQGNWSQVQQKAFEAALLKFPKSSDRWEKIAKSVPGKSKEECLVRYKHLVEQVKKKKEKELTSSQQECNSIENYS